MNFRISSPRYLNFTVESTFPSFCTFCFKLKSSLLGGWQVGRQEVPGAVLCLCTSHMSVQVSVLCVHECVCWGSRQTPLISGR